MKSLLLTLGFTLLLAQVTFAQQEVFPVIKGYGSVIDMPFETIKPDPSLQYKLLAEAFSGQKDKTELYDPLDYFARVVNAHAHAGVPAENFKMSIVLFSGSVFTTLNNAEFQKRFGTDNPNLELIQKFQDAGVDVFVCGQSMMKQDIMPEMLIEGLKIGSSRITVASEHLTNGFVSIY
ncbi:DsrE family protein [Algoriphagus namhaensis]|uniref:DsrE family protein n=1 Tax=Algoriphagus namhaensis TaxID=915353 RepID=A0ABV8AP63_9BACT